MEFAYDGGGLGKGGTATLFVDGGKVGEGRLDATVPMVFSADETTDLGSDTRHAGDRRLRHGRTRRSPAGSRWVELDIGDGAEDLDHLITPEERCADRDGAAVGRERSSPGRVAPGSLIARLVRSPAPRDLPRRHSPGASPFAARCTPPAQTSRQSPRGPPRVDETERDRETVARGVCVRCTPCA